VTRITALGLRVLILATFALFFIAPVVWLILAPTKSDHELITAGPFSFGSFHQVALAWKHLDAFSDHIFRAWIGNSLLYAFSATAIVLATAIPAGYGLAFGSFPGRRLVLSLTLVVMIMPAAALVLPIFLELNSLHLIGSAFAVILPFAFFPFGVYLAYIYYATAVPRDLLDAARTDGCGEWLTFRRVALPLAKPVVARLLLQLRRRLEQLLPSVRRHRRLRPVSDPGRALGPAVVDAVVQPGPGWRWPAGEHLPAGAGARHAARGHSRRDRVPAVAACARARPGRRGGEGVIHG
jgi:ABC-type glycerol-3-phosphate transport system permease component